MKLQFLGTGASEGVPAYYCRCAFCKEVRIRGGKDIRSRTSFRIGDKYQIDFSPDTFYQMVKLGLDIYDLEHILITHSHEDHFDIAEILTKDCETEGNNQPLNIYLSEPAAEWSKRLFGVYRTHLTQEQISQAEERYKLVPLQYYQHYRVGELEVTAVRGNHRSFGFDEMAINYLIGMPDGTKLLYASDTGWYSDETWQHLEGMTVNTLIMECTYGGRENRGLYSNSHLDVTNFLLMLDKMKEIGFIRPATRIFATHINSAHHLFHEDLQAVFDKCEYQVTVAYDGLII